MMAVVAQAERKMISARTKAALAAAKAPGRSSAAIVARERLSQRRRTGGRIARTANANNRAAQLAPQSRVSCAFSLVHSYAGLASQRT
jgi:DNA invertase Pin-like site-specific DNA recombinase